MGNIVPYLRAETITDADREYLQTRQGLSAKASQLIVESQPPTLLSYVDTTGWGAATLTVTYDAKALFNIDDATRYNWLLKDVNAGYVNQGGQITHPTPTQITVSFEIEPGASTYQLVGAR